MFKTLKKRGSLLDPILVVVIVFALGFTAILGYKISGAVNDNLQASSLLDTDQKQMLQDNHDSYISVFDIGFLIAFVFLFGGIIIGAFMIDTHPIFLPIFLFLAIFITILAALLGNVFYDATTGTLADARSGFPIIVFVMNNFVKIIVVTILATAGALYAKMRGNQ